MNAPPGAAPAGPLDPNHAPETRLYGSRLILAWIVGGAWVSFSLGLLVVSLPGYLAQFQTPCLATGPASSTYCMDGQLSPAATTTLQHLGLSVAVYATLTLIVFLLEVVLSCALAVLLVARRPHDWMALLVALMLATIETQNLINSFSLSHAVGTALAVELTTILDQLFVASITLVFYLFPNGRFVPRWTRWMVVMGLGVSILLLFFPQYIFAWTATLSGIVLIMVLVSLVIAQVYRYLRVSTQLQRQQTKVVVYCVAVPFLVFAGVAILETLFPSLGQVGSLVASVATTLFSIVLLLIPISIAIAILRYRLWDIDALINRTLVYGLLTGILGTVYAGLIIGLQSLAGAIVGQESQPVVIVISTLAIATLVLPLRRLLQALIDRRFYRRKYDAEKILAAFSTSLQNEVDLSHLREQVLAVVQETMQPAQVSLWLRQPEQDHPNDQAYRPQPHSQVFTKLNPD